MDWHPRARPDGPVVLTAVDDDGETVIVGGTNLLRAAKKEDADDVLVAHLDYPADQVIEKYAEIVMKVGASLFAPSDGDSQLGLSGKSEFRPR